MPTYDDIYVRDNFGDSGSIPSTGNPYQSPDLIPCQSGVLTMSQLVTNYPGPDIGMNIVQGGVNNIYVRGRNLSTSNSAGRTTLNRANSSLLLLPEQWVPIQTMGGQSEVTLVDLNSSPTIGPGAICAGSQAFVLTGLPPSNFHYCLIGIIQTNAHPITVPTRFDSNAAFASWVQTNPAVGWRNVNLVANTQVQDISSFLFGSTDPNPAYFYFQIKAPSGNNYATNTGIQVQCTDSRCPFSWSGTLPAPDSQGNQITGFQHYVPGNMTMTLTRTLTSPDGRPFPREGRIEISYYEVPPGLDEALEASVSRDVLVGEVKEDGRLLHTTVPLIKLGQCWTCVSG